MDETPHDSTGSDCLIDLKQFKSMSDALGDSFPTILGEFFESCAGFGQRLRETSHAGEFGKLREVCHEIKGAAGLIGLGSISRTAAGWESLAAAGQSIQEQDLTDGFEQLVAATKAYIGTMGLPAES